MVVVHPVVPSASVINRVSVPTLVSWAVDEAGHPYAGPHGARYVCNVRTDGGRGVATRLRVCLGS